MWSGLARAGTIAAAILVTTSACTSQGALYRRAPVYSGGIDRLAYDRGYTEGREKGASDASRRRSFDYQRHKEFRKADAGYRGYGDRNQYRTLFREGFVAGYDEGYRRYTSGSYGYPAPPASSRAPVYRAPTYGRAIPRYGSVAAENGYRDGYEAGRRDAADRRRADPVRVREYREGDRGYNSRYGSRDDYKREYRSAFMQGYDAGYRSR